MFLMVKNMGIATKISFLSLLVKKVMTGFSTNNMDGGYLGFTMSSDVCHIDTLGF